MLIVRTKDDMILFVVGVRSIDDAVSLDALPYVRVCKLLRVRISIFRHYLQDAVFVCLVTGFVFPTDFFCMALIIVFN